jgi:hypothetical protein
MRFFHRNRAKVCGPEMLFEELEERIVMDASVDPTMGTVDGFGLVPAGQVEMHSHMDAVATPATTHEHGDWNLQYSSDPSVSMVQVLDDHVLADVNAELGTPPPSITLGSVPTVTDSQITVDLSSVIRIGGDPTEDLTLTLILNPRPLTSSGIYQVVINDAVPTSLVLTGNVDIINQELSTLQATLISGFNGTAEIDVTLSDPELGTTPGGTQLVTRTVLIPVSRAPFDPVIDAPGPQTVTSGVLTPIPAIGDPNILSVSDTDSHELGVIVRVDHGILLVPLQPPDLMNPSVRFYGTEGPDGSPLPTGPLVGIRGQLPDLWNALAAIEYQSFPGYHGADNLTVYVTDRPFSPVTTGLTARAVTPITVVV